MDRTDDVTGYQVHVIYAVPSDGVDRELDTNGQIARSVAAIDRWFRAQAGGPGIRLDTLHSALDVSFARLPESDVAIASHGAFVRDVVQGMLEKKGFADRKKVYAVYYDGSSTFSCGGGAWPPKLVGHVAALYLQGKPPNANPCSSNPIGAGAEPSYIEFSFVHEILHTIGFVAECAPHHVRAGHVSDDPRDLMYAGDAPWRPSLLDIGHDDYFAHGRPDCLDLAKSVFMDPLPEGATVPPSW